LSLFGEGNRKELRELVGVLAETDLLQWTKLQTGVELMFFNDMNDDANDFDSQSVAFQFSNSSEYLGYKMRTLVGIAIERRDFGGGDATTTSTTFVTIYAGLR
jgi:hypothetical protein